MMKQTTRLLCILLITFAHTGCITEEQFENTPQGNFEALWKIIDERYCFFDYKAELYGLDWNEVKSRYNNRITPTMGSDQLFEVLGDMIGELKDGHVNIHSANNVIRYWNWFEDHPVNFYESIQIKYLGSDYKVTTGLKYKILDDNIAYVYCESFNITIGDGVLDAVFNAIALSDGLILDLRNNSGGSLATSERLARRFILEEKMHTGYIQHKTGKRHNDFSKPRATYLEAANGVKWQKEVVVLTNRKCYSATNDFVKNIQHLPLVTVLGDTTGGGSGLPFSSELPNGWSIRFSACPIYDRNLKHTEFGIEPDVKVDITPADFSKGIDTIIERARALLKNDKRATGSTPSLP